MDYLRIEKSGKSYYDRMNRKNGVTTFSIMTLNTGYNYAECHSYRVPQIRPLGFVNSFSNARGIMLLLLSLTLYHPLIGGLLISLFHSIEFISSFVQTIKDGFQAKSSKNWGNIFSRCSKVTSELSSFLACSADLVRASRTNILMYSEITKKMIN